MSLYNMVCGNNPLFGLYARILDEEAALPPVARYRDMYTMMEGDDVRIVLYTRTGGSNRVPFAQVNEALACHALYLRDYDDEFDSTFAHFAFRVPDRYVELMKKLHAASAPFGKLRPPGEKMKMAVAGLKGDAEVNPQPTDEQVETLRVIVEEFVDLLDDNPSALEKQLGVMP